VYFKTLDEMKEKLPQNNIKYILKKKLVEVTIPHPSPPSQ
jgi:hypothetical protein